MKDEKGLTAGESRVYTLRARDHKAFLRKLFCEFTLREVRGEGWPAQHRGERTRVPGSLDTATMSLNSILKYRQAKVNPGDCQHSQIASMW